MRLENEERFVLDNNNLILDMEDTRQKYNLEPEEICELLNMQERELTYNKAVIKTQSELIEILKNGKVDVLKTVINVTENVLDAALKNSSLNSAHYDKLLDTLDRLLYYAEGESK